MAYILYSLPVYQSHIIYLAFLKVYLNHNDNQEYEQKL